MMTKTRLQWLQLSFRLFALLQAGRFCAYISHERLITKLNWRIIDEHSCLVSNNYAYQLALINNGVKLIAIQNVHIYRAITDSLTRFGHSLVLHAFNCRADNGQRLQNVITWLIAHRCCSFYVGTESYREMPKLMPLFVQLFRRK